MTDDGNASATLRELLDVLTSTHDAEITQAGRFVGWRTQDGLLVQLRKARASNITGSGGGASAAHERSPLNTPAVTLYAGIERRIREWAIRAGIERHGPWPEAPDLLTTWHAKVHRNHDFDPHRYVPILAGWIGQITDLIIDPPRQWTPKDHETSEYRPCPLCGKTWADIKAGVPAILVTERDPVGDSTVTCRACGSRWEGLTVIEALAGHMLTASIPVQQAEAS